MITFIKFLTWLASPMGIFTLSSLVSALLLILRKAPKTRLLLITLGVTQLLFFAWPPVAAQLTQGLENKARTLQAQNIQDPKQKHAAILLLGGGITPAIQAHSPPIPANASDAIDRVIEAARLYHQGVAPIIIVSGGNSLRDTDPQAASEAAAMKDLLVLMGVPEAAIYREDNSLTTSQNMAFTAALLKAWDIHGRMALVTSATHMPRASRDAQRAGLETDAYPTDWTTPNYLRPFVLRWLPNAQALEESERAIKEWISLIAGY